MRGGHWFVIVVAAATVALGGCEQDAPDGGMDGSTSNPDGGASGADGGGSSGPCATDVDCDDGVFCNGAERCATGDPGADGRGCVPAAEPACLESQSCDEDADACQSACDTEPDADGDGARALECGGNDCDDSDALRYPGNVEICDAVDRDEDCDPATFGVRDADSDGEPDAACCNGDGCGTDCDDTRAGVNRTATETCNGIDDDCDGSVDEGVQVALYLDDDGDGHGDPSASTMGCAGAVPGHVESDGDCDDTRADIHPGAVDRCDAGELDEDCSGTSNDPPQGCTCTGTEVTGCELGGICAGGTRMCVDGEYGQCSIRPEPFEICDGEDDDCNGTVDDGLRRDCWADGDGDGYAASGAEMSFECATPSGGCPAGYTARAPSGEAAIDCADGNGSRSPGATEACNQIDDDCDGSVDESLTVVCYRDEDNDTYAASGASATGRCPDDARTGVGFCPLGWTDRAPISAATTDCNDAPMANGSSAYPSAPETCDTADNDCDGSVDEGATVVCFADGDDDGFASAGADSDEFCRERSRPSHGYCPASWTARDPSAGSSAQDCDDADSTTFPEAPELCGGGDNDCDGTTTDEMTVPCYSDSDGDGYAASGATAMEVCPDGTREDFGYCPSGMTDRAPTSGSVDCAPSDSTRNPGVAEMCDEPTFVDSSCNGDADEGAVTCYRDEDDDGYASYGADTSRQCRVTARDDGVHLGCAVGWTGRQPSSDGSADCSDSNGSLHVIVRCYPDSDADSYRRSGSSSTIRCYSSSAAGYGGCPSAQTSRSSPADCCDASGAGEVYPGQGSWFTGTRPSSCGSPAYDYDCNGANTRRWTTTTSSHSCFDANNSGECSTVSGALRDGWTSSVPACGDTGYWRTGCTWESMYDPDLGFVISYCTNAGGSRRQSCH